ncbi:hypothetical protein HYALB_00013187 [Hymenoscyphus albidus]|uniref:Uncharacterized protein n=1 Tax=Hymenoscyphus albidus TaxID=595503 RepID=A0A9N9LYZ3_9HELO|nr:hypothetical protein HYALB_00013187 [Hymenoscyphus albidus]
MDDIDITDSDAASDEDIDTDTEDFSSEMEEMEDFSSGESPLNEHRYVNMFQRHLIIAGIQEFLLPYNMPLNNAQELEFLRTLKQSVDTYTLGVRYFLAVKCGDMIGIPLRYSFEVDGQVTIEEEYSYDWG